MRQVSFSPVIALTQNRDAADNTQRPETAYRGGAVMEAAVLLKRLWYPRQD